MSERLLTAAEVAELLAVPESWVREHTRTGRLPRVQLGRYVRYRHDAILAWLEAQETPLRPARGGRQPLEHGARAAGFAYRNRDLLCGRNRANMPGHASIGPKPNQPR